MFTFYLSSACAVWFWSRRYISEWKSNRSYSHVIHTYARDCV